MEQDIMPLNGFIEMLKSVGKIYISVQDLTGMTLLDKMDILRCNQIHSSPVCDCAKMTEKGLKLCMNCKLLATQKAMTHPDGFFGECPVGLSEAVYPVTVDSKVICIVYVGNFCADERKMKEKIKKTAKLTGADADKLMLAMNETEKHGTKEQYMNMAKAVGSYITMLYNLKRSSSGEKKHWIAEAFIKYADTYYYRNISISFLSNLYKVNEKYAGRIFKQQTGMSFNSYLNKLRIERAKYMLKESNENILEISLDCGYNNITNFNRIFKRLSGTTPGEYRKSCR